MVINRAINTIPTKNATTTSCESILNLILVGLWIWSPLTNDLQYHIKHNSIFVANSVTLELLELRLEQRLQSERTQIA